GGSGVTSPPRKMSGMGKGGPHWEMWGPAPQGPRIIVSLTVATPPNRGEPPKVNSQVMTQMRAPATGPITRTMKKSAPPAIVSNEFRVMERSTSMVMPKRATRKIVMAGVVMYNSSRMANLGSFQMRNQYSFRVSIMIGSPFFLYCADDVFLRNGSKMAAVTA